MGKLDEHIEFARYLRRNQTSAEDVFWVEVRNRRFHGYKFRRQVPIDKYFADFVCEAKKLIVELDDISHVEKVEYDRQRTKVLNAKGYNVIRFNNSDIFDELDSVLDQVYLVLKEKN